MARPYQTPTENIPSSAPIVGGLYAGSQSGATVLTLDVSDPTYDYLNITASIVGFPDTTTDGFANLINTI